MTRKFSPALIILLLVTWGLLMINLGSAWIGHQDANGAWISVAVRNYQLHGFFALGGLVDISRNLLGPIDPYIHHPPLMVWMMAFPVLLTGYSEALLRFVTAACTLLSVIALYVLARRLAGQKYALWSAAFYALTPMMAFFGRMPDHEAPALAVCLLFAAVMVNWLRRPTKRAWWGLVVLTVLAVWIAWGALIVIAVIALMALFYTKRRLDIVMLGVVALGALVGMLGYYLYFFNNTMSDLISTFIWRTSMNSLDPGTVNFGWGDYLFRIGIRMITLYTPTIIVLTVGGIVIALRRSAGLVRAMLLALTLGALAYLLLFRNASFIHDYYLIYLAPPVALFAGCAVALLPRRAPRFLRPVSMSLALVTVIPLLIYLQFLYSGSDPTIPVIGQAIREHTQSQDLILSNLDNPGMNIEFYAERPISWGIPPADTSKLVSGFSGAVYYLYCGSGPLPASLPVVNDVDITPQCHLTRLS